MISEHERIASHAGDAIDAGASWWASTGAKQHNDGPHWQSCGHHGSAGVLEQPARDLGSPRALDLDVHGSLSGTVADPEQAICRPLPWPIDAGIERAERLEAAARECQPQDRSRQPTQQMPERDVGLAHCYAHTTSHL
jgi:hypothetical protein